MVAVAAATPVFADNGHGSGKSSQQHGNSSSHATGSNKTSGHNPPGNNGTVKIHDVAGDTSPHNVPHVTCRFWVAFFGFDAGQTLTVSFTGQAPTGNGVPLTVTGAATSITSPDDAGGAANDPDGELGFAADELDLSSLGAPAKQGYHLRLTVATGQGGGAKQKVFWLEPCTTVGATGATRPPGSTASGTTASGTSTARAAVLGLHLTRAAAKHPNASQVLGLRVTRPTSLPFTGARIAAMTAVALALVAFGCTMTMLGRQRRYRPRHALTR
jgi:hypothetical protein